MMSGSFGLMLSNIIPGVYELRLCDGRQTTNRGFLYAFYTVNKYFLDCILNDPFEKGSPAFKMVKQARLTHRRVSEKMNKILPGHKIWFNQLGR